MRVSKNLVDSTKSCRELHIVLNNVVHVYIEIIRSIRQSILASDFI